MTYQDLYEKAIRLLDNSEITIGEYDEMIKPLKREICEWISCSERLPEEGEVVLTQANFKDDIKMAVSSRVDYNYWTGWMTREINIVAWMPLPKPYREDGEV